MARTSTRWTILTLLACLTTSVADAGTSIWDAGGGDLNWGTANNWNPNAVPLPTDSVLFNDTGASNSPGTTTVQLDMARNVAAFTIENPANKYHTFDLNSFALEIDGPLNVNTNIASATLTTFKNGTLNLGAGSNLIDVNIGRNTSNSSTTAVLDLTSVNLNANVHNVIIGEKILGGGGNSAGTLNLGNTGAISIGSAGNLGQLVVGHTSNGGTSSGNADFSHIPTMNATLNGLLVGTSEKGVASGALKLAQNNTITANTVRVGFSTTDTQSTISTLSLGATNTIVTPEMIVGGPVSAASLDIPVGGSLTLGSVAVPTNLAVAQTSFGTDTSLGSSMNLANSTFNATLSNLTVADRISINGNGNWIGTLTGGNAGAITIGSPAAPGNFIVGHVAAPNGGGKANGTVNFSGQTSLTANLNNMFIGTSEFGFATGTVKLAATNNITANTIRVGYSTNDTQTNVSTLSLGLTNTILAGDMTIGGRYSSANLDIPVGGSLTLGSIAKPTNLMIAQTAAGTDSTLGSTMNLTGSTFNATLSNLVVADRFSLAGNGNWTGVLTGGVAGDITIGTPAAPGNFIVGHVAAPNGGGKANGTVDFSGQASLTANLNNMLIGTSEFGVATGSVKLPATNTISANSIRVGYSTNDVQTAASSLSLGMHNTINTPEMIVGGPLSIGNVDIPVGGALTLGSASAPTNLIVAKTGLGTDPSLASSMNLSGAAFNATLSSLTVADRSTTFAGGFLIGTLTGGNSGAITIGSAAAPGNIIIGHAAGPTGSGRANGAVDFSGQTSLNATLNNLFVGTSEIGFGAGTFKLAATNNITANAIRVGYSTNDVQTTVSSMSLGMSNSISTSELTIGGTLSAGQLDIPLGGSLTLGTAATPTNLSVGKTTLGANSAITSTMNLTGATFDATLSNLTVGDRVASNNSNTWGAVFTGGSSGAIAIGSPATPGNLIVGHSVANAGLTTASANLSGQTSLVANLQNLSVGVAEGGTVTGALTLAKNNTIDAQSIRVGQMSDSNSVGQSTLTLGQSNSILADSLIVASKLSNATINAPANAVISLGSAVRPTSVVVAQQDLVNTQASSGTINFAGSTFNAFLSNLTVGERSGGATGATTAVFTGGSSGAITIGSQNQLSTVEIGHAVDGGTVVGTVNFGGQTSLNAWIDRLDIGVATGGTARGALTLANTNTIHANTITVGSSSVTDQPIPSTLTLGLQQSIYANSIAVGGPHSVGAVAIVNGGLLNLGTPGSRVDLSIGRNIGNSAFAATSTFDLTGGVTQAFLGSVIIGEKSGGGVGTGVGVFTTGLTNNQIDATQITLGVGTGDGTFNFNGGSLTAQTIQKGTGAGQFNWNGGTLHVQTFGAPVTHFDLVNGGAGVLAPGATTGVTNIFGSYTQSANGTTQIDLGGALPGVGYDQVLISNAANLAGAFSVQTVNGFEPTLGQTFTVMTFGSRVGDFSTYAGLDQGAVTLHPSYVANSLVLAAQSTLDGDVNLDGVVDIADMTAVANHWQGAGPAADANYDGIVDIQDVTLIANHWLESLGGGGGASALAQNVTLVPEPSTYILCILGGAFMVLLGRTRCRGARV